MGFIFASKTVAAKMPSLNLFSSHKIIAVPDGPLLDERFADHVDLKVFCDDKIILSPDVAEEVIHQIRGAISESWILSRVVIGDKTPQMPYPNDVPYNVLALKQHLIHKLKITEPQILKHTHKPVVNVRQGYTRCSVLPVGEQAVITDDASLGDTLQKLGYDVLIICKGHVQLAGFPYGLFGGSGGSIGNKVVMNGCLKFHPDAERIKQFILKHHKVLIELDDQQPLIDCGSILFYDEGVS